MDNPVQTLIDEESSDHGRAGRQPYRLLVFSQETLSTHPLPNEGEVVIGRSSDSDIQVDVPAISRRHALIRVGPTLTIEDLGSSNGTKVRGDTIKQGEAVPIGSGDAIELGSVTVIVQRASPAAAAKRPRRLWTHGYFEGRLEEECSRAVDSSGRFAVMRIRLQGGSSAAVVQEVLAGAIGSADVVASYGPGEYEVLLLDRAPEAVDRFAERLQLELNARGAPASLGVACWSRDGRDPDALFEKACAEVRGEPARGAEERRVIVEDPQMVKLHQLIERIAQSAISVILAGETGVGKEVFAEGIHRASPRADRPLLRLNCAALSESLLESELFGHEKGAFTGAIKSKPGLLESAQGGTVLLDEVGELPISIQVKLLRVIEQREVMRVGDVRTRPIDVRFVSATNRDLEAEVKKGTFRQDLFFRLNGIVLVIPPLRERVGEIEPLVRSFVSQFARQMGRRKEPELTPDAVAMLNSYSWPGNIRELRNVIERAVLLAGEGEIGVELLPVEKLSGELLSRPPLLGEPTPVVPPGKAGPAFEAERKRILEALERCGGNQTLAARLLGISRRTMLTRLDEYAIPRPRKVKPG
ncbi:MAG: sigma 54-interacting transcriptional regulator [Myxococcales bacterium]|nr:sigma 54-interacting transcriptional regulator [Myxococcales bacterium]